MDETLTRLYAFLGTLRIPPVVLCIGSDRVTGDCTGPLVGHLLQSSGAPCVVVGSLTAPVTALNLPDAIALLKSKYPAGKVIAVDSCVGSKDELGKIRVLRGALRPGLACGKRLPKVGDVSITASVAYGNSDSLYSVRLGLVYPLAQTIADAIGSACRLRLAAQPRAITSIPV